MLCTLAVLNLDAAPSANVVRSTALAEPPSRPRPKHSYHGLFLHKICSIVRGKVYIASVVTLMPLNVVVVKVVVVI